MSRRLASALKEAAIGLEAYITEEAREIGRLLREREAKASERGREEGREQGLLRAVLALVSAREVPVDAAARAQLESCTDPARLERWVVRASTAARVEDVLEAR